MLKTRDLHTQATVHSLEFPASGSAPAVPFQTMLQYEVTAYTDTRNLASRKCYLVTCTQRLIVPNPSPYTPGAETVNAYMNYPALLQNSITVTADSSAVAEIRLVDYSPRTINTAVQTSLNSGTTTDSSTQRQYTSGSSIAHTNSFGTSVNAGFMGDAPTGGISASRESSTTTERYSSTMTGSALDTGAQVSNSSGMSIKDWGSYASIDSTGNIPTWVWSQEYPWNVLQFRNLAGSTSNVLLPDFVEQRLYDGSQVYPPSELSLFGIDFVSTATWLVIPNTNVATDQTLNFSYTMTYCAASHEVVVAFLDDPVPLGDVPPDPVPTSAPPTEVPTGSSSSSFVATIAPVSSACLDDTTLDLAQLALDPVFGGDETSSIINFAANLFDAPPTSSGGAFSITADTNDLLIRGSGFNSVMSTDFTTGTATMTAYFKVVNKTRDVSLSLKHWVAQGIACKLSVTINGGAPIERYVDMPETATGGDNVTTIALRCNDFTSIDYCNYVAMGLNTLVITVEPADSKSKGCQYTLMAIAIG